MQQFKTPELDRYLCEENHGVRSEYGSTITYTFDQHNAKFVRSTQIDEALEAFRKSNRGYMLVDAGYMCTQDKTILMLTKWKMLGCENKLFFCKKVLTRNLFYGIKHTSTDGMDTDREPTQRRNGHGKQNF